MKGREGKAAPPTDLLVCFPSRAHLSLMPKQICSPVRGTEASKRHNHHLHLARANNYKGGQVSSPLLWAKTKANMQGSSSEIDEPTSPKVTCAGQIKVRPKSGSSCKNWQSVMEEIERLHNNRSSSKHKKKATWVEAFGFKKDVMQFLTCLRGLRFDLRCFGNFHGSDVISDDDEDEEEEEEDESEVGVEGTNDDGSSSKTVFSKWFMVLQENQNNDGLNNKEKNGCEEEEKDYPSVPPPNALLLMRCRSAPAKSWLEEKEEEEQQQQQQQQQHQQKQKEEEEEEEESNKKLKLLLEEEKKKESLILKCYSPDFFKVSSDVAKETWVVGGMRDPRDPLSRSRSWKR
ncbi:hypothetical protein BVC80_715g3 [Macleaya cordata]|uniref:Uncharacterized protein n=1 Tax=Macleaya cordata TaxID=56857 RepID=A0A200PM83_MACCD|nr:hypothetical protein BVC80_715g3 [Macleaya cordata]